MSTWSTGWGCGLLAFSAVHPPRPSSWPAWASASPTVATPPAAILFIVFTIWGLKGGAPVHLYDSEEGYYYLTLVDALLVGLPAIVLMLGIGHFAGKALKGRAANLVLRTSSDLNRIYLIHWIFVLWVVNALLYRTCGLKMSSLTLLVISFVILALSAVLARCRPFSRFKL